MIVYYFNPYGFDASNFQVHPAFVKNTIFGSITSVGEERANLSAVIYL